MDRPVITRLEAYGVCPDSTAPQRYVGTDIPFRLSAEILRLTLSDGTEGIASTCSGWRDAPVGRIVSEAASRAEGLVGQDGTSARQHVAANAPECSHPDAPDILAALLDTALWEAHARSLGKPLHRLLGATRDSLPAYTSTPAYLSHEDYLADVETTIALGCKAVKFHFNGDPDFDADLVERVAAEFRGASIRFAADLEGVYAFDDAVALAKLLEAHDYLWLEAPFPDDRIDAYAALRQHSQIDLVAPGYDRVGPDHWTRGLALGAWSRLRFDVSLTGVSDGLTGAAVARGFGCPLELQSFGYMPAQAANLAVMLASRQSEWFELPLPCADFRFACKTAIELDGAGRVTLPDGTGLGITMDFDLIGEVADSLLRID